jgi:hypothetical protein
MGFEDCRFEDGNQRRANDAERENWLLSIKAVFDRIQTVKSVISAAAIAGHLGRRVRCDGSKNRFS